jgi:hypothetical protein
MQATPGYDELSSTWTRLHRLGHLQSIAGWDQAANMPAKGNEARAAALAEMAAVMHRMRTDPKLPDQLARAEQEPLRARLAPATAGQRLAGLPGQLPRGAGHRPRRSGTAVGTDRHAQVRRHDGPL